ncbi:MAG: OmpA family protein [Bacteroidetes bacterium]|nr:OmpA family protein [Bacteroidota bacterium]
MAAFSNAFAQVLESTDKFLLKGKVISEEEKKTIPNATVYLVGSDGTQAETKSDSSGNYEFNLLPNIDYGVNAVSDDRYGDEEPMKKGRKKYLSSPTSLISTIGVKESKVFEQDIAFPTIMICRAFPEIQFEFKKWDLSAETKIILNIFIKEALIPNPTMSIELKAYSDSRENEDLSQKRADAIVQYLIEKGIDPNRLIAKGYGKDNPKEITKENFKYVPYKYMGSFPIGTVLDKKFISSLTKDEQEVAHQMNRHAEFRFLCTDWAPGKAANACTTNK